jgi:peroxiredoxin
MTPNPFPLPANLPVPLDDGACRHLVGLAVPDLELPSTSGRNVSLRNLPASRSVVYCYPMTGVPGKPLPEGWDLIPGARGCTPQTCGFRDHHRDLLSLRTNVFGLSTQEREYQKEMVARLHLPFEVLSDARFQFCDALKLPTFEVDGMRLIKRLTLILRDKVIEAVFYPVFPPDRNAEEVMHWLAKNPINE